MILYMVGASAADPDIDLIPVLSATLAEALELPPAPPAARRLIQTVGILAAAVMLLGAAIAAEIAFGAKRTPYYSGWIQSNRAWIQSNRAWLGPVVIGLSIGFILWLVWVLIPVWNVVQGLLNEYNGRGQQAMACYRRAVSRYVRGGGYPPFKGISRMMGLGLFWWKLTGDQDAGPDSLARNAEVRDALEHLPKVWAWWLARLDLDLEAIRYILTYSDTIDYAATDQLDHVEAFLNDRDLDNPLDSIGRGFALQELGHYKQALAFFDRAAQASEISEETEFRELVGVLGAAIALETGDLDDCEHRLRDIMPADLDIRVIGISLECKLACARSRPERAVAILERTAARVQTTKVTVATLADLAFTRARALRMMGRHADALSCAQQAVAYYQQLGPQQASEPRLELAMTLAALGRREEAIAAAVEAAAELDARRYQLDRISNRLMFIKVNEKARALALELVVVDAPRLVAELIESARVQGMPVASGDDRRPLAASPELPGSLRGSRASRPSADTFSASDGAQSAALTATGLAPLTPPPRLDLFTSGDSGVGRVCLELPSAGSVVLAQVAEAVAGKEWWWWGSWVAGSQLYWSLLGHEGTVEAGAIPVASLERVLTRLALALPSSLPGETPPVAVARARSGALANPDEAAALATELGTLIIPRTLRDMALARAVRQRPLSLVVAPAPVLGRVPFGLLGLGRAGVHLAHGAVVRLGVSAALLEQIRRRKGAPFEGRVLCVVDPCQEAPLQPEGRLREVGVTHWTWLQDGPLLTRSGHLPELGRMHAARLATIAELSKALCDNDAGVLAYMGHVSNASDDMPANASLVLDGGMLSAHDLLYDGDPRRWPMPSRVALIGCGSGGANAPEWLGLAPASLWAGAQVVVATAWDLIGEPATWQLADEIVSVLKLCPDPAAEWRERFINHLDAWKSHAGQPSPLSWGAVQFVGVLL